MSSACLPTLDSLSSPRSNTPHNFKPIPEGNDCVAWCTRTLSQQPRDAYPSPTASHQSGLQEPSSVDALCLPPFWGTCHNSDLTVALISAKCSERRAEYKLIQKCLKRINIEKELYSLVEVQTHQRLHKADINVGVTHGVLCVSGLTPSGDDPDSDVSSLGRSDGEESS
ncbi:uncharacterized protein F5891DRAFT_1182214 [Suillus fuscotomentosus]|uniref:Uncharacterized protein n=1 Tax=Suillus fuscotomentosus TaxID=1912939 RepID=A0AAD4EIE9_9AGAM|nr:uncharacterized protein F5891DRAFT_1182214 [Suillus fuscotomentosus]KAG1906803.1 hypothetical protein F5891DRAFT_1182214 [Suillus fuscotomentosus]